MWHAIRKKNWKILQLHIGSYGHFNQVFLAPRDLLKAFKASLHMEEQLVGYDVKQCMESLVVNMVLLNFIETSGKQVRGPADPRLPPITINIV